MLSPQATTRKQSPGGSDAGIDVGVAERIIRKIDRDGQTSECEILPPQIVVRKKLRSEYKKVQRVIHFHQNLL